MGIDSDRMVSAWKLAKQTLQPGLRKAPSQVTMHRWLWRTARQASIVRMQRRIDRWAGRAWRSLESFDSTGAFCRQRCSG